MAGIFTEPEPNFWGAVADHPWGIPDARPLFVDPAPLKVTSRAWLQAELPIELPEASARSMLALAKVHIGRSATGLREAVYLHSRVRDQGLYVPGKNGMGKSTFLLNLVLADILMGCGVCVLDPHRDLVDALLPHIPEERLGDVVVLDVLDPDASFGLNLFACKDPANERAVQDAVTRQMHLFTKLWGDQETGQLGPRMSQYLRNAGRMLVANGLTMTELPQVLTDKAYRDSLLAACSTRVRRFWAWHDGLASRDQLNNVESSYNKAEEFSGNAYIWPIVGQAQSRLDFRALMDERKIVLVKLSAEHEDVTRLVGSTIGMELLKGAQSRANIPREQRVPFMLYVDELDYFSTPDFAAILKGGRKFGICTTIAHQEQSQLTGEILGSVLQVGNLVSFAVTGPDADRIAKQLDNRNRPGTPQLKPLTITKYDEVGEPYESPVYDYEFRRGYHPGRFGTEVSEQEVGIPRYRWQQEPLPVTESERVTANELATLQPYRAKARIRLNPDDDSPRFEEYNLVTPAAPEVPDTSEIRRRIEQIRQRSRDRYCTPRALVEQELRERGQRHSSESQRTSANNAPTLQRSGTL